MDEREICPSCNEPSGVAHVCAPAAETRIICSELSTAAQKAIEAAQQWLIAETNIQKTFTTREAAQYVQSKLDQAHENLRNALEDLDSVEKRLKLPKRRELTEIREVHEGGCLSDRERGSPCDCDAHLEAIDREGNWRWLSR